jgi:release factor glutamine methyltransferase
LSYKYFDIELDQSVLGKTLRYQPSDDTYLILKSLVGYRGKSALEIGIGSGAILRELSKRFSVVVGTDIDFAALSFCNQSNDMEADLVCCDGTNPLATSQKYDLIVSNPPYLPYDDTDIFDRTIYGGITGSETAIEFLKSAICLLSQHGAILILLSSLSNLPQFYREVALLGLSRRTISRKRLFFETLLVEEIKFLSSVVHNK